MSTKATLNYMRWNKGLFEEKPYQLVSDDMPRLYGIPRQNFEIGSGHEETISDVRSCNGTFNLDDHAFTFVKHIFPEINYENAEDVETVYKPAIEAFLKQNVDGADEVKIFDWRLRKNRRKGEQASNFGCLRNPVELLVPAHYVHVDQTLPTAIDYVRELIPDRADELLKGRVRIINVWKPFGVPAVTDCPLAVCDGSTVNPCDLIVCDNIKKDRIGEVILPLFSQDAKWYYMSNQTPEDVVISKIVDSDFSVKAACCPHSAFDIPDFDNSGPLRKSIEIRALVFTYAKE